MKKTTKIKEAVVLLIAAVMILSSIVVIANTEDKSLVDSSKLKATSVQLSKAAFDSILGSKDTLYIQTPVPPEGTWTFTTSDVLLGYLVQDNFHDVTGTIEDFHFWGLPLIYNAGWTQGNPENLEFELIFYEDDAGAPGAVVATYSNLFPTYSFFANYAGLYDAYLWEIDNLDVDLAAGWVSVQSTSSPSSTSMLWACSIDIPPGDGYSLQNGGALAYDEAFELTGGGVPPTIPDLDCSGELDFVDVEPNATVSGTITVENNGEPDSELDWEVESYPEWGTWTFDPESGTGLAEGDSEDITVDIVAPDEPETTFEGEVVLVNSDDSTDTCTIQVSVAIPYVTPQSTPTLKQIKNQQTSNPLAFDDIVWQNGPDDGFAVSSQRDLVYPFISQVADDFIFEAETTITDVHWFGQFWGGDAIDPIDFEIFIYADDGTGNAPTGGGMPDPSSTALAAYTYTGVSGLPLSTYGNYEYEVDLTTPFVCTANEKYWLAIVSVFNFPPQWGWVYTTTQQMAPLVQGFPLLGTPFWTVYDPLLDAAFYLTGFSGEPSIPDLDCIGELDFVDVEPNATVSGTITVENNGEAGSELNWEVESYPDWGTWTFDPESGTGLAEGASVDITVDIVAPDEPETTFEGEVVLVNSDDSTDTCTIQVSVVTPVSQSYPILEFLAQRFPILARILALIF